jgi:hypothetical protein
MSPRDRAVFHQQEAEALRSIAHRETRVAELLRACIVEQQELLLAWENMDPDDALASEALALEAAFQEAFSRTVRVVKQAVQREQDNISQARRHLKSS